MEHQYPPAIQTLWNELQTVRGEILKEIEELTQAQADWRPKPDEWSIGQNLRHLLIDEADMGKVTTILLKEAIGVEKLTDEIFENAVREGKIGSFPYLLVLLDDFGKLPPPPPPDFKTLSPEPEYGLPLKQLIEDLKNVRARTQISLSRISRCDPRSLTRPHLAHQSGPLNLVQWWRVQARHDSGHLRQIKQLKAHPEFPTQ